RVVFFFFILNDTGTFSAHDLPSALLNGLCLDISATGYLMVIPVVLYCLFQFFPSAVIKNIFRGYNFLLITVCSILLSSNLFVYRSWGTLINFRALSFISDPSAITASVSNFELFGSLSILAVIIFIFYRLSEKMITPAFVTNRSKTVRMIFSVIVLLAINVIMIRGGLQMLPVNESIATFSSNQQLN